MIMITKKVLIIIWMILLLGLVACDTGNSGLNKGSTPTPNPPIQIEDSNEAYPIKPEGNNSSDPSSYPAPANEADEIQAAIVEATLPQFTLPSIEPPVGEGGTIVGRLIDATLGTPASNMTIIVGEQVFADNGVDYMLTVQENSSPRGITDEDGYFIVSELPAGVYSLVLFTPIGSKVLEELDGNEGALITLEGGEVMVVGDVRFSFP